MNKSIRCDACASATVNGVFVHEHGCPKAPASCRECGSVYSGSYENRQAAAECCEPVEIEDGFPYEEGR